MADDARALATFMLDESDKLFGEPLTEAELHDFLYLLQREALIINDEVAFEDSLIGAETGPKCPAIWLGKAPAEGLSPEGMALANRVLRLYGGIAEKTIKQLTTNEIAWLEARHAIKHEKNGTKPLRLETMRLDAAREKLRRKNAYR